jgi:hypothetical protein
MKIAVFMLATPGLVGANISEANAKAYCSKWGYDFVLEETLLNEKVSAKWNKILWLIEILPQYDAVFILDADAIFVNFNVPLGEYVSDGMEGGDDSRVNVNKLFEEYVYAFIEFSILNSKLNVQEYIITRARKRKGALLRNAKIRISDIHPGRLLMNLRGQDKWIK